MKRLLLVIGVGLMFSCSDSSTRFERLVSDQTGIDFENTIFVSDSFHIMNYEYIYNGGGVGIGDLNNDGFQDIFFSGNMVSSKVYLNLGDFKFQDITSSFEGLSKNQQWFSGVTMIDINNDRLLDVYLSATADDRPVKRRNRLWVNQGLDANGIPSFMEMVDQYGIGDEGYSVHSAFFDYDLDGDLDLYVMNNIINQNVPTNYRTKIVDGSADNNDKFYQNQGDGTFIDITIEAGIVYEGYGLGLAIGDLDRDGYPDMYISNDYMANDLLYINQGDGTFKNEIGNYLSYQTKSSMGNDMADINNDGFKDIYTLDMLPEYYLKKKQSINGFSYAFYINDDKYGYEHQYLRNMLHINNGLLRDELMPFNEVGQMSGIYQTEWSWSPLFADYDNDGDKDLLISNGYPKDVTDKDWTKYQAQVYGFLADENHVMQRIPALKASNFAFENVGPYSFEDKTEEWGMDIPSYSYGASFADFDNDGDLDYITNNMDDKAFVYKNNTISSSGNPGSNYLKVKLIGLEGNTMALGSKVEIWTNGNYQIHEHFLSRGYISSVEPAVHFGLGEFTKVDSIKITWPTNKSITILREVEAGRTLEIMEAESLETTSSDGNDLNSYMFEPGMDVMDYTHREAEYVDFFQTQHILPHKFSQLGPELEKGDINGDGQDDILIGASNIEPTQVYLRKGNGFTKTEIEGLTTRKWAPEADLAIIDIDNDGDNDVIAVSGGYSNENDSDYRHFIYKNEGDTFIKSELPVSPFISTTLSPFDFDHDGDMDLFIGARVKRDLYPFASNSMLLLNEHGEFKSDPAYKFNLGMVTDAIWSDYDGDGWEDLIITREWNSIAILKNNAGEGLEIQTQNSFSEYPAYWYTIAGGDFDLDGDTDYIAGGLGENHRFTISPEYPMKLYPVAFDRDDVLAPFITGYWKEEETGEMVEYPVNYLDELAAQSQFLANLFENYTVFSKATSDYILGGYPEQKEHPFYINTSSSYVLWNEGGEFRWERLPDELQTSPITNMIVQDLNGDEYPDVIVTGNDYTFDVPTGYYDANKGIIMLSEGKESSFKVLTSTESGFLVKGQVGSMLYFEGDTSLVVTGINRGKVVIHKHLK